MVRDLAEPGSPVHNAVVCLWWVCTHAVEGYKVEIKCAKGQKIYVNCCGGLAVSPLLNSQSLRWDVAQQSCLVRVTPHTLVPTP